jgi:hypothetical protein
MQKHKGLPSLLSAIDKEASLELNRSIGRSGAPEYTHVIWSIAQSCRVAYTVRLRFADCRSVACSTKDKHVPCVTYTHSLRFR